MPLIPNFLERLGFRWNLAPGPYLEVFEVGAYKAVSLANRFDIFEKLRARPQTAKEMAESIGWNERATSALLELLAAFGYLELKGGRFANSATAAKWLHRTPQGSFSDAINAWDQLFEFWSLHEQEAMRDGRPSMTIYDWFNQRPESWRTFHIEEKWFANLFGDEIASKLKVPTTARKLLDVGGGHGMYSVKLCRRHPKLTATVFDQPKVLEFTKEVLMSEKMADRISMRQGDFLTEDPGSGYDVVLLFNVVHGLTLETNKELLRRLAGSLNYGGMLVIFDQFTGGEFGPVQRAANRFWGLAYLTLLGGQVYSASEVTEWLRASGLGSTRRINIRIAASDLLVGYKKPA
jgi:2-polyprenyl-3-methyl-5-hydroxy-6-metoxy-1,4-benzoquinol methylase